jgi:hypothetical protein
MFRKPAPDADYGAPPQNHEELINSYVKDSWWGESGYQSSQRFGRPRKAYSNKGLIFGGSVDWIGYVVPFSLLDAKGGRTKVLALIHDDTVHDVVTDNCTRCAIIHYVD